MVVIASAVLNKKGKEILSRQFVDIERSSIEGLLAAFPKVLSDSYTIEEIGGIRYVYQPLEELYVLVITNKASNIIEDIACLRLFVRVVTEYCSELKESTVYDQTFDLIFAFDEVVTQGYRENVTLSQVQRYIEMDSLDENMYNMEKIAKEKQAKKTIKQESRRITQAKLLESYDKHHDNTLVDMVASKLISKLGNIKKPTFTPDGHPSDAHIVPDLSSRPICKPRQLSSSIPIPNSLKLTTTSKENEFMAQLRSEEKGDHSSHEIVVPAQTTPTAHGKPLLVLVSELIEVEADCDMGLIEFKTSGSLSLRVFKSEMTRCAVTLKGGEGISFETHPRMSKSVFASERRLELGDGRHEFPLNADASLVKWHYSTKDQSKLPLSVQCWPSPVSAGGCTVSLEYSLQSSFDLYDLLLTVPLCNPGSARVSQCETGEYSVNKSRGLLEWRIMSVSSSQPSGLLEFTADGVSRQFFPVTVTFESFGCLNGVTVGSVNMPDGVNVEFDVEEALKVKSYTIRAS